MKKITIEIADDEVLVALKRHEGYEDVHPELVAEDAIKETWPGYRTLEPEGGVEIEALRADAEQYRRLRAQHRGSTMSIHETIAEITQIQRGQVWCTVCGRMQRVDGVAALRGGWPKCCSLTMTIDSPEERAALARSSTEAGGLEK